QRSFAGGSIPFQGSSSPGIEIAGHQNEQEENELGDQKKSSPFLQLRAKKDRPRKQEGRFDIEDEKEDGSSEKFNRNSYANRPNWGNSRFPRLQFHFCVYLWSQ